jgi:hypothetical protein
MIASWNKVKVTQHTVIGLLEGSYYKFGPDETAGNTFKLTKHTAF